MQYIPAAQCASLVRSRIERMISALSQINAANLHVDRNSLGDLKNEDKEPPKPAPQ